MENITLILLFTLCVLNLLALMYFFFFKKQENKDKNKDLDFLLKNIENLERRLDSRVSETYKNLDHKLSLSEREMKRVVENQFDNSTKLLDSVSDKLTESERETRKSLQNQFAEANKLIQNITEELTSVKEGNKQVFSMTEQLSNLEKVLTNQKQRGSWGKSSLELILSNILPATSYEMQYKFQDGDIVDAAVFIKDKILPIDSKFSLENYQKCIDAKLEEDIKFYAEDFKKDLKNRILETAKYIKDKENTLSIAFMFLPSEAIYYDLLAGDSGRLKISTQKLIEFAQMQKVFIVSPTSILAYLHLVLSGIKAFNIEENAKAIQKKVEELGKHIENYEEFYKKLGNSLSTTVNHYNSGYKELKKIDKDVYKITEGESGGSLEIETLDKPLLE